MWQREETDSRQIPDTLKSSHPLFESSVEASIQLTDVSAPQTLVFLPGLK